MGPVSHIARQLVWLAVLLGTMICSRTASAQTFNFNFGASSGSVVGSIANQTCGGGGGMGGMGGACDGTPFIQQVINTNGGTYYHVIVGNGGGEFGIETYIQTVGGGVCWYGCANARVTGGMGGMGGGPSPLSASNGSATNDSAPLASNNAGTGNPTRAAIRQYNNTAEMSQEFLKATISQKPRITQTVSSADMQMDFTIDMTNSNYSQMDTPGTISLTQQINIPGIPNPGTNPVTGDPFPSSENFDINNPLPNSNIDITGGRFTYSPGNGDGGSLGAYNYFAEGFDVYNVDWASFCDPAQNPVSGCSNYGGVRGGMGGMGGAGGGGGGMGGGAVVAPAPVGGGTTTGGGATMGGGTTGGGMGGGAMAVNTAAAAQPTSSLTTRTTTTNLFGGATTSTIVFSTTTSTTTTTMGSRR